MSEGGPKITLLAENCWICKLIVYDDKDNTVKDTLYIIDYKAMTHSPKKATILQDFDAGERFIWWIKEIWKDTKGRHDGFREEYSIVSMYDELMNNPRGKKIEIKKS